jgi:hypothetical protein
VIPFPGGGEIYLIKQTTFAVTYQLLKMDDYTPPQAEALTHRDPVLGAEGSVYCKTTEVHAKESDRRHPRDRV